MGKQKKENIRIEYKCLGASHQVTGSCHYLKIISGYNKYTLVIDYGMVQDNLKNINEIYKINKKCVVDWTTVDGLILTHSHADHCALLPLSVMNGYEGHIYSTAPTIELTRLILSDSASIQARDCEKYNDTKKGKKEKIFPLYGQLHVENCLERFRGYDYDTPIVLNENIKFWFKPAGHLLGASSILIEVRHNDDVKTMLFTGDTSASQNIPFVKKPNFNKLKVDYLFSESTYGNRVHSDIDILKLIEGSITNTCLNNNGTLFIPVFSVGRSTTILSMLYDIYKINKVIANIPIYLASPMACKSHRIYGENDSFNFYNIENEKYRDLFSWDAVSYIEKYSEVAEKLFDNTPKIILSSSGMIQAGYSTEIAYQLVGKKQNEILFVGYQGAGTTGRKILDSKFGEELLINDKKCERKCSVSVVSISGHADSNQMIELYKQLQITKIKKVFLNHGDDLALDCFKNKIEQELCSDVIISSFNRTYVL